MELICGDSLKVLTNYPENYFDSCVTDPPYGLTSIVKRFGKEDSAECKEGTDGRFKRLSKGFMGKEWDGSGIEKSVEFWKGVYRVLKPGAHLLAFGGTRTWHRIACAIEDAGFEIRDSIYWCYGQGFPKSHDISKQIDSTLGYKREIVGYRHDGKGSDSGSGIYVMNNGNSNMSKDVPITEPVSDEAKYWDGWGTALKPAIEPIILARKPISEKTVALNILRWGTGAINIDDSRIELNGEIIPINKLESWSGFGQEIEPDYEPTVNEKGRWPSNIILDEEAGEILNAQHEGASRFFYCAKASKKEKNFGLDDLPDKLFAVSGGANSKIAQGESEYIQKNSFGINKVQVVKNTHPTVKPIKLMEYLVTLITPKKGIVLDPFAGSFSTGVGCKNLGFDFVGIELNEEYFEIGKRRINDGQD